MKIPVECGQIPQHRRIVQKTGHRKTHSSMKYENFVTDTAFFYERVKCLDNQVPRDLSPEVKQPEHEAEIRDG